MKGKAGSKISGTVTFTETANGVAVTAHLTGIEGSGPRGFHLHETGNCSAADFSSAGGHFNPTGAAHGAPDSPEHHAGDLGNVEVGADGTVHLERVSTMLTVASGPNSVVGRAVILHEKADDLTTQPTGNAGGRVACGVVISGEDGEAEPVAGEEEDGAKSASEPKPVA
jgi:Cu-Zn family superoxide dismutase